MNGFRAYDVYSKHTQRDARGTPERHQRDTRETPERHQKDTRETPEKHQRDTRETPEGHQRNTRETPERHQRDTAMQWVVPLHTLLSKHVLNVNGLVPPPWLSSDNHPYVHPLGQRGEGKQRYDDQLQSTS